MANLMADDDAEAPDSHVAKRLRTLENRVYVLRLRDGSQYVGVSSNPALRLQKHAEQPNEWIARGGLPDALSEDCPLIVARPSDNAYEWEERETLIRMLLFGPDRVRGGQYTQCEPMTHHQRKLIAATFCQYTNACFHCGRLGHGARSCSVASRSAWLQRMLHGDGECRAPQHVLDAIGTNKTFAEALHFAIEEEQEAPAESPATSLWTGHWLPSAKREGPHGDLLLQTFAVRLVSSVSTWTDVFERGAPYEPNRPSIWLIDVTSSSGLHVDVVHRIVSQEAEPSYLLELSHAWPTQQPTSFDNVTFLLYVSSTQIWALRPKDVRQQMVHVGQPLHIDTVKDLFGQSQLIAPSYPRAQSTLTVMQDPPGSGKTYRLVRLPLFATEGSEYDKYETFLYITKPHSAKEVVYKEFSEQMKAATHVVVHPTFEVNNAYCVHITRHGRRLLIMFMTGDSLMSAIGQRSESHLNVFEGICNTIRKHGPILGHQGQVRLKGETVHFNAQTLVCVDEATKFTEPYLGALLSLLHSCNADGIVAGDLLQSIEDKNNLLAKVMRKCRNRDPESTTLAGVEVRLRIGDEIRRCGETLVNVIGNVVAWHAEGLPLPRCARDVRHEHPGTFAVEVFPKQSDDKDASLQTEVEIVLNITRSHIFSMELLPDELLCVFLFVTRNAFGDALRDGLDALWKELLMANSAYRTAMLSGSRVEKARKYFEYYDAEMTRRSCTWLAHFHRSESGRPIRTQESARCTRMVSVHAAQGDGRRLVFVFGLQERALKSSYTFGEKCLRYESFVNVCCSRAKEKTIAFQHPVYDDIWKRFRPYIRADQSARPIPWIDDAKPFQCNLVQYECTDALIAKYKRFMQPYLEDADQQHAVRKLVDFEHHEVRFATIHLIFQLSVGECEKSMQHQHVKRILLKVHRASVFVTTDYKQYHRELHKQERCCIPLLNYARSQQDFFQRLCDNMKTRLEEVKEIARRYTQSGEYPPQTFLERPENVVILLYAMQHLDGVKHPLLRMDTLYNTYAAFYDESTHESSAVLREHYECVKRAHCFALKIISQVQEAAGDGQWLSNHMVTVGPSNREHELQFKVQNQFPYVYVTATAITVILLRAQVNATQEEALMWELLGHTFALCQPHKQSGDNVERFANKKQLFVLASLSTCWLCKLEGFDALVRSHKTDVVDAMGKYIKRHCQVQHSTILDVYQHWGKNAIDRIRNREKIFKYVQEILGAAKHVPAIGGSLMNGVTQPLDDFLEDALETFKAELLADGQE